MENIGKIITIKEIMFESNDPEVIVKGSIRDGVLSYNSEISISHSQLNILLNQFNQQDETFSINHYLTSEKMENGEQLYTANTSDISSNSFSLGIFENNSQIRQIRA